MKIKIQIIENWDIAKALLIGKFIAWNTYIRKKDIKSIIYAFILGA